MQFSSYEDFRRSIEPELAVKRAAREAVEDTMRAASSMRRDKSVAPKQPKRNWKKERKPKYG